MLSLFSTSVFQDLDSTELIPAYPNFQYYHASFILNFKTIKPVESYIVDKVIFFLFLGLRILRPKFLHFRKKIKILFLSFFIFSDVKNC